MLDLLRPSGTFFDKVITMSKLPEELPYNPAHFHRSDVNEAYSQLLKLEISSICALQAQKCSRMGPSTPSGFIRTKACEEKLIYVRFLGYMILHLPESHWGSMPGATKSSAPAPTISEEIVRCEGQAERIFELGKKYVKLYISAFHTREEDEPPLRFPKALRNEWDKRHRVFATTADMTNELLARGKEKYRTHGIAMGEALVRDGYCCVLSQGLDRDAYAACDELREKTNEKLNPFELDPSRPGYLPVGGTGCAHIVPPTIKVMRAEAEDEDEFTWSNNLDEYMEELPDPGVLHDLGILFRHEGLQQELKGANINRIENVITLGGSVWYSLFMEGKLWFTATDQVNVYRVDRSYRRSAVYTKQIVTFPSLSPPLLPPSATYLLIHATLSQISDLSGAATHIELLKEIRGWGEDWDEGDDARRQNLEDILSSSPGYWNFDHDIELLKALKFGYRGGGRPLARDVY